MPASATSVDHREGLTWGHDLDLAQLLATLGGCQLGAADDEDAAAEEADAAADAPARDLTGAVAEQLPPGPALAALLSGSDLAGLGEWDLPGVASAYHRIAAWAQAGELAAVAEMASRTAARDDHVHVAEDGRPDQVTPAAASTVGYELVMAHPTALAWTGLGVTLRWRLAATWQAMNAGQIDLDRAKLIAEAASPLDDDTARAVEQAVLPKAGDQTSGQLRVALRRAVIAADPEGAEQRRQQAQRHAKVSLYPDPDADTATLAGTRLPSVHAAAAMARLTAIARAMKSAGLAGGLDYLRANAFIGLLLGTLPLVPPPADDPGPDGPTDPDPGHPDPGLGPGPSGPGPDGPDSGGPGPRDTDSGHARPGRHGRADGDSGHPGPGPHGRADGDSGRAGPGHHGRTGTDADNASDRPGPGDAGPGPADSDSDSGRPGRDADTPGHHRDPQPDPPLPRPDPPDTPPPDPAPAGTSAGPDHPCGSPPDDPDPPDPDPPGNPGDGYWDADEDDGPFTPGPPTAWPPIPGTTAQTPPFLGQPPPSHPPPQDPPPGGRPPPSHPPPGGQLPPGFPPLPTHPTSGQPGRPPPGQLELVLAWRTLNGDPAGPATLSRVGPITARQARLLALTAAADPHARWQVILTDPDGLAIAVETVRRRHRQPRTRPAGVTGLVAVTIPAAVVAELTIAGGGIRAAVLRAARRALASAQQQAAADAAAPGGCAHTTATPAYRPTAKIRDYVTARDQTCRNPRCRQPARHADLDHTTPWHKGGPTCRCNLGGACRRDHKLKQLPGWTLTQPRPGYFQLTTPAGRTYTTRPDPYPT